MRTVVLIGLIKIASALNKIAGVEGIDDSQVEILAYIFIITIAMDIAEFIKNMARKQP